MIVYKGLIGKEDHGIQADELMPTTKFARLNSIGGSTDVTYFPDVWKTHNAFINARYYKSGDRDQVTIQEAVDYIGSDDRTLYIEPGAWTVSENLTIPSNIRLLVDNGAVLTISSGKTLTINGPFEAGLYQVFSGSGSVVFGPGSVKEVNVSWWGAKGDGVTDDTVSVQSAFDSIQNGGAIFFPLTASYYKATDEVTIPEGGGFVIRGVSAKQMDSGLNSSTLRQVTDSKGFFRVATGSRDIRFQDLHITGGDGAYTANIYGVRWEGTAGVDLDCSNIHFNNVVFTYLDRAIEVLGTGGYSTPLCSFRDVKFIGNYRGIYVAEGAGNTDHWSFDNITFSIHGVGGHVGIWMGGGGNGWTFRNVAVGGGVGVVATFIQVAGQCATEVYLENVTSEQLGYDTGGYFLDDDGYLANTQRWTLVNCNIGDPIRITNANARWVSINSQYYWNITFSGASSYVYSIQDRFPNAITLGQDYQLTGTNTVMAIRMGDNTDGQTIRTSLNYPTYGATVAIDTLRHSAFKIIATDTNVFTVNDPTNDNYGQRIILQFVNSSGGTMGDVTFGSHYRLAGAFSKPANGYSRSYEFISDVGPKWVEINRSAADTPI